MRITNNMLGNTVMRNIFRNLNSMQNTKNQASTGLKVLRSSDDPIATTLIMGMKSMITEQEQHMKNMNDGIGWLDATDSALNHAGEVLKRAYELALQGANGTNSDTSKESISHEIEQLIDEIKQVGNTNYAGRYVFAGSKTTELPFVEDTKATFDFENNSALTIDTSNVALKEGLKVKIVSSANPASATFNGNALEINLNSGDNTQNTLANIETLIHAGTGTLPAGLDPTKISVSAMGDFTSGGFNSANTNEQVKTISMEEGAIVYTGNDMGLDWEIAPGVDVKINLTGNETLLVDETNQSKIITTLQSLKEALTDDTSPIKPGDLVDEINGQLDDLLNLRAQVGAKSRRLDMAKKRMDEVSFGLKGLKSELQDADLAEVSINYAMQEAVYNASLMMGARIIQPSLLQFLK